MKQLDMFIASWCPYCKRAFNMIAELRDKHPDLKNVEINVIDEDAQPQLADQYDYYYVPTFFLGEEKLLEGVPTLEKLHAVLMRAAK